jgi:hypothetical protein
LAFVLLFEARDIKQGLGPVNPGTQGLLTLVALLFIVAGEAGALRALNTGHPTGFQQGVISWAYITSALALGSALTEPIVRALPNVGVRSFTVGVVAWFGALIVMLHFLF